VNGRTVMFAFGRFARWSVQVDRGQHSAWVVIDPPKVSGLAPVTLHVSGPDVARVDQVLAGRPEDLAVLLEWLVDEAEVEYQPWTLVRAWEAGPVTGS
jgi:hypothetical protein